jgi:hypothetical protein
MQTSYFSAVSANLFAIDASGQIPHAQRGPPEFGHYSRQTPKHARRSVALRDLQQIQQRLTADTLQLVVEIDLAAHTRKRESPRISRLCRDGFSRFFS